MGCFLPHTCFGLTGPNDLMRTPMFRELHTHIFREKGGVEGEGEATRKQPCLLHWLVLKRVVIGIYVM